MAPREIARKLKRRIEVIERDLRAIEREDQEAIEEEKRLERYERERLKALRDEAERLRERVKPRPGPVSRGPKRPYSKVRRRRGTVLELRYRGFKQGEISQILNTPIRTIQRDCAFLRERAYERLRDQEIFMRERLSVFTNEEMVEVFLGSPERVKELWERPTDKEVRFKLVWVKR